MNKVIVLSHCGVGMAIIEKVQLTYPDAEVITYEEAKARGYDIPKSITVNRPIRFELPKLKECYFEDIRSSGKEKSQSWKRRGKNNKV